MFILQLNMLIFGVCHLTFMFILQLNLLIFGGGCHLTFMFILQLNLLIFGGCHLTFMFILLFSLPPLYIKFVITAWSGGLLSVRQCMLYAVVLSQLFFQPQKKKCVFLQIP